MLLSWSVSTYAQHHSVNGPDTLLATTAINQKLVVPTEYQEVHRENLQTDGQAVILTRYTRRDGRNNTLGGEHFSSIYDKQGRIKGFIYKDLLLTEGKLPTEEDARVSALTFVKAYAPDLLNNHSFNGISQETEFLELARSSDSNKRIPIHYLRVKMRNKDTGLWFWVFVGVDRRIIGFERDLVWSYLRFQRTTEQWLSDAWRAHQGAF